jgi:hypothetical protein
MAWQTEMVLVLRHIIDDLDPDNYTFSDNRLEETILASTYLLQIEIEFLNAYQVDVDSGLIYPDPTLSNPKDDDFIALCCIQAGIVLYRSILKTYSLKGVSIRDGASSIDLTSIVGNLKTVYQDLVEKFDHMKLMYQTGKYGFGKSILGPYSPGSDTANRGYIDYRAGFFA